MCKRFARSGWAQESEAKGGRNLGSRIWDAEKGEELCSQTGRERSIDESTAPPGTAPDGFSSYSQDVVFQQTGSRGDGCEAVI